MFCDKRCSYLVALLKEDGTRTNGFVLRYNGRGGFFVVELLLDGGYPIQSLMELFLLVQ